MGTQAVPHVSLFLYRELRGKIKDVSYGIQATYPSVVDRCLMEKSNLFYQHTDDKSIPKTYVQGPLHLEEA